MKNAIQPGKNIKYTASGAAITSGEPVMIGHLPAVSCGALADGEEGAFELEGIFKLPHDTGLTITKGQRLFFNASTKKVTNLAANNKPYGVAASANDGDGYVECKVGAMAMPLQIAAVADIATADGSDAATTQALANAIKAKVNDLLGKARTSGVLAT